MYKRQGVFTAPTYVIQSSNYNNVGAAFVAVDAELTDINARIVAAGGIQGERGYSAYDIATQNGYAGSEADWLASLRGETGLQGPIGAEAVSYTHLDVYKRQVTPGLRWRPSRTPRRSSPRHWVPRIAVRCAAASTGSGPCMCRHPRHRRWRRWPAVAPSW